MSGLVSVILYVDTSQFVLFECILLSRALCRASRGSRTVVLLCSAPRSALWAELGWAAEGRVGDRAGTGPSSGLLVSSP